MIVTLVSLAIYFFILFIITYSFRNRLKTIQDYFIAGKSLGIYASTASLSATGIGGSATLVATAYIYKFGLAGIWMNLGAALGLFALGLFLAKRVNRFQVYSLPELIENLFDQKTRKLAALLVLMAEIAWLALTIQATAAIITVFFPESSSYLSFAITLFFILYTFWGGQYAISYTDLIQLIIVFFGIILLLYFGMAILSHGSSFASLPAGTFSFPANQKFSIQSVITLSLLIGLPHMVGSDIYAKIISARNPDIARRSALYSALIRILWGIAIAILGLMALLILPESTNPNLALPYLAKSILPDYMSGIFLAALLAILMSSADTILLTSSTVFSHDLMGDWIAPERKILYARLSTALIGLAAFLLATQFKSIIKTLELGYTIFAGGLIIPVLFGFLRDRYTAVSFHTNTAFAAMLLSGSLSLALKLKWFAAPFGLNALFVGMLSSLLLLTADILLVRLLGKRQSLAD